MDSGKGDERAPTSMIAINDMAPSVAVQSPLFEPIQQKLALNIHESDDTSPSSKRIISERIEYRKVSALKLHASLTIRNIEPGEHEIFATSQRVSALRSSLLTITEDGTVLDSEAVLLLARRRNIEELKCIVCALKPQEILPRIIRNHLAKAAFSRFLNVELSLEVQTSHKALAKENQRRRRCKEGLPILAKDKRINFRQATAKLAGVGNGTVPKVEKTLRHAIPAVLEAARRGDISIERAYQISHLKETEQLDELQRPVKTRPERRNNRLIRARLGESGLMIEVRRQLDVLFSETEPWPGGSEFQSGVIELFEAFLKQNKRPGGGFEQKTIA